jgi:hypothetical protein
LVLGKKKDQLLLVRDKLHILCHTAIITAKLTATPFLRPWLKKGL